MSWERWGTTVAQGEVSNAVLSRSAMPGTGERSTATSADQVADQVTDALDHLFDTIYLQTHPLARFLDADGSPDAHRGVLLRKWLLAVIELFRPMSGERHTVAWRRYELLRLRYVEALRPVEVQQRLSISKTQYYREQERALAAVASALTERLPATAGAARGDVARRAHVDEVTERSTPDPSEPSQRAAGAERLNGGKAGRGVVERPAEGQSPALPHRLSTFVGRQYELTVLEAMLARRGAMGRCETGRREEQPARLLTLVGPPGVGKTRLALELGQQLARHSDLDVRFVDLQAVRDPDLVLPAIMQGLGAREVTSDPAITTLCEHLRGEQRVLILDNFEQVLAAAAHLIDLLAECSDLQIVVTSRAALRVEAEREFPVQPLAVPLGDERLTASEAQESDAVHLFVARAQAIHPEFALTDENASTIAEICRRLDGLPLAIELAAARVRLLSPAMMLARLGRRLTILTGGPSDWPQRHRTLRAALDWGYELLGPEEQRLFRRLAVFRGGVTLDALTAIGDPGGEEAPLLDTLESLARVSLIRWQSPDQWGGRNDEPRFFLLETVREYAMERLQAAGEANALQRRVAVHYLDLATESAARLEGPDQVTWLDRLEAEQDNLRAALGWVVEQGDIDRGLRAATALWRLWHVRGNLTAGRRWIEELLVAAADMETNGELPAARGSLRAAAHNAAGLLAGEQGSYRVARSFHDQALELARQAGDRGQIAAALVGLGHVARGQGALRAARVLYQEALELYRDVGSEREIANAQYYLAHTLSDAGDYAAALKLYEACWRTWQRRGDWYGMASALSHRGLVAHHRGDAGAARDLCEQSVTIWRRLGHQEGLATALRHLGLAMQQGGEMEAARDLYQQSLKLRQEGRDRQGMIDARLGLAEVALGEEAYAEAAQFLDQSLQVSRALGNTRLAAICLVDLAATAAAAGQRHEAVRILASASATLEATGTRLPLSDQEKYEQLLESTRTALGEELFWSAWREARGSLAGSVDPSAWASLAAAQMEVPRAPDRNPRYTAQLLPAGRLQS